MGFLASLLIRLTGDSSGFQKAAKECEGAVSTLSGRLGGLMRFAGRFVTVAAFTAAARSAINYAGELQTLKERLDVSALSAQQLAEAARNGGGSMDNVAVASERVAKAMSEVFEGGNKAAQAIDNLKRFGVAIDNLENQTAEDVLRTVFASMAEGGSDVDKVAAGIELFGKSYGKLIPIAKELQTTSRGGPLALSDDDLSVLDKMGDQLDTFGNRAKAAMGKILIGLRVAPNILASLATGDASYTDYAFETPDIDAQRKQTLEQAEALRKVAAATMEREQRQKAMDAAAKAHMSTMDRVNELEKEAADIGERARVKALTDEQRRNELLERRAAILEHLKNAPKEISSASLMEINANLQKELAQINLDLASDKTKEKFQRPSLDGSARQGLFLGSRNDPLIDVNREQLNVLRAIERKVGSNGDPLSALNQRFR